MLSKLGHFILTFAFTVTSLTFSSVRAEDPKDELQKIIKQVEAANGEYWKATNSKPPAEARVIEQAAESLRTKFRELNDYVSKAIKADTKLPKQLIEFVKEYLPHKTRQFDQPNQIDRYEPAPISELVHGLIVTHPHLVHNISIQDALLENLFQRSFTYQKPNDYLKPKRHTLEALRKISPTFISTKSAEELESIPEADRRKAYQEASIAMRDASLSVPGPHRTDRLYRDVMTILNNPEEHLSELGWAAKQFQKFFPDNIGMAHRIAYFAVVGDKFWSEKVQRAAQDAYEDRGRFSITEVEYDIADNRSHVLSPAWIRHRDKDLEGLRKILPAIRSQMFEVLLSIKIHDQGITNILTGKIDSYPFHGETQDAAGTFPATYQRPNGSGYLRLAYDYREWPIDPVLQAKAALALAEKSPERISLAEEVASSFTGETLPLILASPLSQKLRPNLVKAVQTRQESQDAAITLAPDLMREALAEVPVTKEAALQLPSSRLFTMSPETQILTLGILNGFEFDEPEKAQIKSNLEAAIVHILEQEVGKGAKQVGLGIFVYEGNGQLIDAAYELAAKVQMDSPKLVQAIAKDRMRHWSPVKAATRSILVSALRTGDVDQLLNAIGGLDLASLNTEELNLVLKRTRSLAVTPAEEPDFFGKRLAARGILVQLRPHLKKYSAPQRNEYAKLMVLMADSSDPANSSVGKEGLLLVKDLDSSTKDGFIELAFGNPHLMASAPAIVSNWSGEVSDFAADRIVEFIESQGSVGPSLLKFIEAAEFSTSAQDKLATALSKKLKFATGPEVKELLHTIEELGVHTDESRTALFEAARDNRKVRLNRGNLRREGTIIDPSVNIVLKQARPVSRFFKACGDILRGMAKRHSNPNDTPPDTH